MENTQRKPHDKRTHIVAYFRYNCTTYDDCDDLGYGKCYVPNTTRSCRDALRRLKIEWNIVAILVIISLVLKKP